MPKDKKKDFKIWGRVLDKGTGKGLPNMIIAAFDKDLFKDDPLGTVRTDSNGYFEIHYGTKDFRELIFDRRADIYLKVMDPRGNQLLTTKEWVRREARESEGFVIRIPTKWPEQIKKGEKKPEEIEKVEVVSVALEDLPGIGPSRAKKLKKAGIKDGNTLAETEDSRLKDILGNIDIKKMKREAKKLVNRKKKKKK
jgi:carotenoid cleavage dioxygenase